MLDGVSQVSTLRGVKAARDSLYCYFPHYNHGVTGTVPGVYVRRDDWKLIRLFNGNPDQSDRFELFNLHDDVGETKNLAADRPDLVRELDALISEHLQATKAIVPGKNPAYSPEAAKVFVATLWQANSNCTLKFDTGALLLTATDVNPDMTCRLAEPIGPRKLTLRIRMTSSGKGSGRLFWQERNVEPPMHRDRSVTFDVEHDGAPHDYQVNFEPKRALLAVRLDPARGPGEFRIEALSLHDAAGNVVKQWDFLPRDGGENSRE